MSSASEVCECLLPLPKNKEGKYKSGGTYKNGKYVGAWETDETSKCPHGVQIYYRWIGECLCSSEPDYKGNPCRECKAERLKELESIIRGDDPLYEGRYC